MSIVRHPAGRGTLVVEIGDVVVVVVLCVVVDVGMQCFLSKSAIKLLYCNMSK